VRILAPLLSSWLAIPFPPEHPSVDAALYREIEENPLRLFLSSHFVHLGQSFGPVAFRGQRAQLSKAAQPREAPYFFIRFLGEMRGLGFG
jgi:hypothetical protein